MSGSVRFPPVSAPRTCIIGAGLSGITAAKELQQAGVPYTSFEASDDVGGNWYFKNPNRRSSAYRSLHIDTSKNALAFRDYAMPASFPDFPHHTEILEYLRGYADHFGIREHIRFNTRVEHAERLPGGGWEVTPQDGEPERFDALLVCNGHHWDASYPDPPFPGTFDGDVIHSHDYIDPTDPLDLVGKRVVVVGIGNSAVDIVSELARKGVAARTYISTRSGAWVVPKYVLGRPVDQVFKTNPHIPLRLQRLLARPFPYLVSGRMENFGLPKPDHRFLEAHPTVSSELLLRLGSGDAIAKPNVAELLGDRVRFEDGSVEEVDAIIYATGYRVTFPFFDEDFLSAPGNVFPLWKRLLRPGIPDLGFIGFAQAIPTLFPFCEAQAQLAAQWLAGTWAPPSDDQMWREIAADERRYVKHYARRPRHTMQVDCALYTHELDTTVVPEGVERARSRVAA